MCCDKRKHFVQKLLLRLCLLIVIDQCKSDLTGEQTKPLKYAQEKHFNKNSNNHHSEEYMSRKNFKASALIGLQNEGATKILQDFCLNRKLEGE